MMAPKQWLQENGFHCVNEFSNTWVDEKYQDVDLEEVMERYRNYCVDEINKVRVGVV